MQKENKKENCGIELYYKTVLSGYVFQSYVEEVQEIEVEKISLSLDKSTINKGEKIQLKTTITPDDAVDKSLKFTSDNTNVATISSDGYILGVGAGTAKITATASNGVNSSINITVYSPVTDLIVSTNNCVLQIGEEFILNASVLPEDASNKDISFESENAEIVTVDSSGKLIGVAEGKTNIIVRTDEGNISKKVEITVIKKLAEGEIVFDNNLQVNANEITGLENKNNTVDNFLQKIKTNYTVEIYNTSGEKIDGSPDENLLR